MVKSQRMVRGKYKSKLSSYPNMIMKRAKQHLWLEVCCGCEANRQEYMISGVGSTGSTIDMYAIEDTAPPSCLFRRCCCATHRPFEMDLIEPHGGAPLLTFKRKFSCLAGFCCCQHEMRVWNPATGSYLGKSTIPCLCYRPKANVYDKSNEKMYEVKNSGICPCIIGPCCKPAFSIRRRATAGGKEVGGVKKLQDGGLLEEGELTTELDAFQIDFPPEADEAMKAVLMSAFVLIDMSFVRI